MANETLSETRQKFEIFERPAIEAKAHQDSGNTLTLYELKELIRHGYEAGMAAGRLQGLEEAAKIAEGFTVCKIFSRCAVKEIVAAIREKANG